MALTFIGWSSWEAKLALFEELSLPPPMAWMPRSGVGAAQQQQQQQVGAGSQLCTPRPPVTQPSFKTRDASKLTWRGSFEVSNHDKQRILFNLH